MARAANMRTCCASICAQSLMPCALAVIEQRGEVARVGGLTCAATAAARCAGSAEKRSTPPDSGLGHAARAGIASVTISPMRTRKSVLMVGR